MQKDTRVTKTKMLERESVCVCKLDINFQQNTLTSLAVPVTEWVSGDEWSTFEYSLFCNIDQGHIRYISSNKSGYCYMEYTHNMTTFVRNLGIWLNVQS